MATEVDDYTINEQGCWVWKTTQSNGYGRVTVNGKRQLAHRVMYEMLVGSIPHGMELDHLCRNRSCANPEHLEAVTHAENVRRGMSPRIVAWRAGTCEKGHTNRYVDESGKTVCRDCRNARKRKPPVPDVCHVGHQDWYVYSDGKRMCRACRRARRRSG